MLLAYLGPETLLPLTSIVAGIAGAFLMFGKNLVRITKLTVRLITGRSPFLASGANSLRSSRRTGELRLDSAEDVPRRASERRRLAKAGTPAPSEPSPSAKSS